jgi:c-di-GMP-binding flagellar brake protein YcgR
MKKVYKGKERRQFVRLDYVAPLAYKVCKKKTVTRLLQGYTANISEAGLLCTIKEKVKKNDIIWFSFDRTTLGICEDLEKRSLIYQNGILGKVVRIVRKKKDAYNVGIQFITREEKNLTHIFPKIHFLKKQAKSKIEEEEEMEEEELQEESQEEQPEEELKEEKEQQEHWEDEGV